MPPSYMPRACPLCWRATIMSFQPISTSTQTSHMPRTHWCSRIRAPYIRRCSIKVGWMRSANCIPTRPCTPSGITCEIAGWTTTEVGRQPWTVYGLLRTADSVSPSLTGTDVMISLAGYIVAYLIMFPAGLLLMVRLVRRGPVNSVTEDSPVESGMPNLSARSLPISSGRPEP